MSQIGKQRSESSPDNDASQRYGIRTSMPPTVSFAEVLAAAKNQHKREIGWLYQRYVNVVYRYALARVADISTAEDLTSETFFAMIRNISTTRAEDELTFAAWLLGIARNQVLMHFRKARAQREVELLPHIEDETQTIAEEADPLLVLMARESWAETAHAINQLTLEQRTVILYRCILGFPTEYVAEMMGRQPGTIRALQFRALNSLARFLKAYPDSEMPERGRNRVG